MSVEGTGPYGKIVVSTKGDRKNCKCSVTPEGDSDDSYFRDSEKGYITSNR